MDTNMIKTQAVKFSKAQNNLLLMVIITTANLFLIAFEVNFGLLFSAFVPQALMVFLQEYIGIFGLLTALVCTFAYMVCYALSKKWRVFILVALVLFSLDALLMLGFILITGLFADFFINILFHAWIFYYLITGTSAWAKLRHLTAADLETVQQEVTQAAQAQELDAALNALADDTDKEESDQ